MDQAESAGEVPSSSSAAFESEHLRWREQALRRLLLVTALAMGLAAAWAAADGSGGALLFAGGAATSLALWRGLGLPYQVRVAALLAATTVPAGAILLRYGVSPTPLLVFCASAVVATVLAGRSWGIAVVALTAAAFAVISLAHARGWLPRDPSWAAHIDVAVPAVAARLVILYSVSTAVVVLAPSALQRRIETLALQRARSLDALGREQAERVRIQDELRGREAEYRRARELEALGRLAGTVAHDFGNALTIARASVADLERLPLGAEAAAAVADLREGISHASSTLQQLRVLGPPVERPPGPVPLAPLLGRLANALGRLLPPAIAVSVEVRGDILLRADEGQLLRVLTNLALNARDAMQGSGRLTLRGRFSADRRDGATIEVVDDGPGLGQEAREHLFEPYFTTKGEKGTGLGLASVRAIVEAAGGAIAVESAAGVGTTVAVEWPLAARETGDAPRA